MAIRTGTIIRMNGTRTRITVGEQNLQDHIEAILGPDPRCQPFRDGSAIYSERLHITGGSETVQEEGIDPFWWKMLPRRRNEAASAITSARIAETLGCWICGDAIFIDPA